MNNRNPRLLFSREKLLKAVLRLCGAIALFIAFGLLAQTTYAADTGVPDPYRSQHGSIWLLADDGRYAESLALETDVHIDVSIGLARTRVIQRFRNSGSLWAEGIYVFPLPDDAAVDHFSLRIGERLIEGQVQERKQARLNYEQARSEGRQAGLIEQQRPNVFTTSLANIEPGGEIRVEFEYQQTLEYGNGGYRLRFPMVVGQRYDAGGDAAFIADGIPTDVHTVFADDGTQRNPVSIRVELDSGAPLARLNSSYHPIEIIQRDESRYSVTIATGAVAADRDFELSWSPELTSQPRASVLRQRHDGTDYALLSLLPPDLAALGQQLPPRELIFILDISGSMQGASIEQAKAALLLALDRLQPRDRFNLIWFNDDTGSLHPNAVAADLNAVQAAKNFVSGLSAGGGTVMKPALEAALNTAPGHHHEHLRQVIFLTDGAVDNEAALFAVVRESLGETRLFTVGIGSAPNAWFMKKAARYGRGTYTFIGDLGEVREKTQRLFTKLESPALVDIRLELDGIDAGSGSDMFPRPVPDLYLGEPLSVVLRAPKLPHSVLVSGRFGDSVWSQTLSLSDSTGSDGVRVAWAREKIGSLMALHHDSRDQRTRDSIRAEIIATSLEHHLLSRYTSLVAVDVTPVNGSGLLQRERLKTDLPHGWINPQTHTPVMLAQTATAAPVHLLQAMQLLMLTATISVVVYLLRKS